MGNHRVPTLVLKCPLELKDNSIMRVLQCKIFQEWSVSQWKDFVQIHVWCTVYEETVSLASLTGRVCIDQ